VDPAVIEVIARRIQSNIRELEGALNRVMACADLLDQPVTLDIANSALADLLPRRRSLTALQVLQTVADYFNATFEALTGRERTKEIAWARQVAMYLIREETESSLPTIGEILERDHTTVLYGRDKVAELVEIAIRERLYQQG
jgi:chromosomal replication initiator protein